MKLNILSYESGLFGFAVKGAANWSIGIELSTLPEACNFLFMSNRVNTWKRCIRERGRGEERFGGCGQPWETVKRILLKNWVWLCVVEFLVLFVKCLCGTSGLEGVKLAPYWIYSDHSWKINLPNLIGNKLYPFFLSRNCCQTQYPVGKWLSYFSSITFTFIVFN